MSDRIKSSVIIPTHNRARLLPLTLRSLVEQTVPPDQYEIIIVDDESKDNTEAVAHEFIKAHQQYNISYYRLTRKLNENNAGESRGRNLGIEKSSGKYIFFTDDDCVVPPNWIEHFLNIFQKYSDIVAVGGPLLTAPTILAENAINRYYELFQHQILKHPPYKFYSSSFHHSVAVLVTANIAYRRDIILEVGKFDEQAQNTTGADADLKKRIQERGWLMYYTPLPVWHLKEFKSLVDLFYLAKTRGSAMRFQFEKFSDETILPVTKQWAYRFDRLMLLPWKYYGYEAASILYYIVLFCGRWIGWQITRLGDTHPSTWKERLKIMGEDFDSLISF